LIDASNSMNHRDGAYTKMDYARWLAASLAWLAHYQGDTLGLYTFREGQVYSVPGRKDAQHLARLFHELETLEAVGVVGDPVSYKHIFLGEQKRELLVFITDMYERNGEISKLLELLAALRHEIIVFHIMGKNELEKDFGGGYGQVEDLETGERISVNPGQGVFEYKERMRRWLSAVRMQLLDRQITYQMLRMDQPLDLALRDFLKQRQQL
jgi:uncharacterized protein (DUF58 family)